MTKFEQIGINYQYDAGSKQEARKSFARSCHACCNRGLHLECDKCAIAQTHTIVISIFDDMEKKGEKGK